MLRATVLIVVLSASLLGAEVPDLIDLPVAAKAPESNLRAVIYIRQECDERGCSLAAFRQAEVFKAVLRDAGWQIGGVVEIKVVNPRGVNPPREFHLLRKSPQVVVLDGDGDEVSRLYGCESPARAASFMNATGSWR